MVFISPEGDVATWMVDGPVLGNSDGKRLNQQGSLNGTLPETNSKSP